MEFEACLGAHDRGPTGGPEYPAPGTGTGFTAEYAVRSASVSVRIMGEGNVFGQDFVDTYAGVKRGEFETFMRVISPWEREFLLLNV